MKLDGRLTPIADISPERRAEMFELMDRFYENMTGTQFESDLAEKQWVIELLDAGGRLRGFSTQALMDIDGPGERWAALFSGDTIIAPEFWGDIALPHAWGNLALSLIDRVAPKRLFWFLISKGYKTYRFLPLFFHEFYPRHDAPTPAWASAMIAQAARRKSGDNFDPMAGVIRAWPGKDRLRAGVAEVTEARRRDPHVRFFLNRNPAHAQGDELCCLAPLIRENFTTAAWRAILAGGSPEKADACTQPA